MFTNYKRKYNLESIRFDFIKYQLRYLFCKNNSMQNLNKRAFDDHISGVDNALFLSG